MNIFFAGIFSLLLVFICVDPALGHVSVRPKEVGLASFQTFTVGVPVEKESATTGVRLVIPEGLSHVTPNVKPGWTIGVERTGEGEEAKVTEISWSGGSIPQGQRDEFLFSAQVPADEATLQWRAYQTYEDGTVVSWDQNPKAEQPKDDHGHMDFSKTGPYSETMVVNDLASADHEDNVGAISNSDSGTLPLYLSIGALVLSVVALLKQSRKK